MITPEHFGAIGTGGDDTAALQAAIDSGFPIIRARPGATYGIGAAGLLISGRTGLMIDLTGAKLVILAVPTSQVTKGLGKTTIKFDTCTRCGIVGGEIDGAGLATNSVGYADTVDCWLEGVDVHHSGLNGQVVSGGSSGLRVSGNRIHDDAGTARGIWLGNPYAGQMDEGVSVLDNVVHGHGATGIVVTSVCGDVRGNRVYDNDGSGIILPGAGGYAACRVNVSGNACFGNLFHGVQDDVGYVSDADLAHGNIITANVCHGNKGSGIYVPHSLNTVISANVCYDNNADLIGSGHGIFVGGRSKGVMVVGNLCYDTREGTARTQTDGIQVVNAEGNIRDITLSGNLCRNNRGNGVYISPAAGRTITGLTVSGNQCNGNSVRGIAVIDGDPASIVGCMVDGNVTQGNAVVDLRVTASQVSVGSNKYTTSHF